MSIVEQALGEDHWKAAYARAHLGWVLALAGRRDEGLEMACEAHRRLAELLGADAAEVGDVAKRLQGLEGTLPAAAG